jgi:signal peptidase I
LAAGAASVFTVATLVYTGLDDPVAPSFTSSSTTAAAVADLATIEMVVDGDSMAPTLTRGQHVRYLRGPSAFKRGDIVTVTVHSDDGDILDIKRVVALPGELVEIKDCQVLIDGRPHSEPYLDPGVVTAGNCGGDFAGAHVPPGHVFLAGDNRAASQDSRSLGPIPTADILGRLVAIGTQSVVIETYLVNAIAWQTLP